MSQSDSSCHHRSEQSDFVFQRCESSDDDGRRLKKREKNRVAAQRSRKRQTQRADLLHETFEYLEQKNRQLRKEVDSLSEEQRRLSEALRTHEPFCPIMHSSSASSTSPSLILQPGSTLCLKAGHCGKGSGCL